MSPSQEHRAFLALSESLMLACLPACPPTFVSGSLAWILISLAFHPVCVHIPPLPPSLPCFPSVEELQKLGAKIKVSGSTAIVSGKDQGR